MTPLILNRTLFNSVILSVAGTPGVRTVDLKTVLWFAAGISLITLFLGLWQWFDQRSRDLDPNSDDGEFFRRQDRRRYVGVVLMATLALAIPADSLLFSALPIQSPLRSTPWRGLIFGVIWLVVCVLIVFLLVLALIDLQATRQYARRHRRVLANERSKLMLEMIHRSGSSDSGRGSSVEKNKDQSAVSNDPDE